MPVPWEFRGPVLVVTTSGHYTFEELEEAVAAAMADPRFRPRMPILFDGSGSEAILSTADIDRRVDRVMSWARRGLVSRCALVARREDPHRFGLGRMLSLRVEAKGLDDLQIMVFSDVGTALEWLLS